MDTIYLDDFLTDGIIKEKEFRSMIKKVDWSKYKNKKVLLKGCTSVPVPTWTYLIIASRLAQNCKQIYYGEPCSAVKIFDKTG